MQIKKNIGNWTQSEAFNNSTLGVCWFIWSGAPHKGATGHSASPGQQDFFVCVEEDPLQEAHVRDAHELFQLQRGLALSGERLVLHNLQKDLGEDLGGLQAGEGCEWEEVPPCLNPNKPPKAVLLLSGAYTAGIKNIWLNFKSKVLLCGQWWPGPWGLSHFSDQDKVRPWMRMFEESYKEFALWRDMWVRSENCKIQ